jgi:hypothetical protein
MSAIDVAVSKGAPIAITLGGSTQPINVTAGTTGPPGPKGDKGDEGGTPVVAVAYADWPPVNPAANTLYLRLAP